MIYKISIPIVQDDEVIFKDIYFEGNHCPRYDRVLEFLRNMDNHERERSFFNNKICSPIYQKCIDSLNMMVGEFPYITNHVISGSVYVDMTNVIKGRFCARQPLTVSRIWCEQV